MPLIQTLTVDAALASTTFPWQGNQYEFLPFDALVEVAVLADAGDTFDASVFSGSDVLLQNSPVDALAIATPITYPDDFTLSDVAGQGERLGCVLTNTSVGIATIRTRAKITPL